MTTPGPEDTFTRDTTTLPEDGPQATQFETASARDFEAPGMVNGGGQAEAVRQRPHYSPVAQPGMVEEIHWHTVKSEQRAPEEPQPARRRRRGHRRGRGRQRSGGGGQGG